MKESCYNLFIIDGGNKSIIYNTLWNNVILIKSKDIGKWGIKDLYHIDVGEIADKYKSILKEKKIIIDDDVDELVCIEEEYNKIKYDDSSFSIFVMPTLGCNFSCWYCYENHSSNEKISTQGILNIIDFTRKILNRNNKIQKIELNFFGGEPLLYFKAVMQPLIEKISHLTSDYGVRLLISITSNGYLLTDRIISFLKGYELASIQITLDGNKERHNQVRNTSRGDDTYSVIVSNVRKCVSVGLPVSLRLNISEETDLNVEDLLADFSDLGESKPLLRFSVYKVWQAPDTLNPRIFEIIKKIRNNGFYCSSYYTTSSSIKNLCYADKENEIVVSPDGNVFKCTARDFKAGLADGRLKDGGEIEWTSNHKERQVLSPLNNKECRRCRILPICIGGCSQNILEHNDSDTCILGMDDEMKMEYAKRVLYERLVSVEQNLKPQNNKVKKS